MTKQYSHGTRAPGAQSDQSSLPRLSPLHSFFSMTQRKCTNTELLLVDMETVSRPTAASFSVYQNKNEILTSHLDELKPEINRNA